MTDVAVTVATQVWLYFLGALFIAVTLFLPQGLMGLARHAGRWFARWRSPREDRT